jgi:hypothetical protein
MGRSVITITEEYLARHDLARSAQRRAGMPFRPPPSPPRHRRADSNRTQAGASGVGNAYVTLPDCRGPRPI